MNPVLPSSMISETDPQRHAITGVPHAMLVASVLAGGLWDAYGPAATFLAGSGFAAMALIGLIFVRDRVRETSPDPDDG